MKETVVNSFSFLFYLNDLHECRSREEEKWEKRERERGKQRKS